MGKIWFPKDETKRIGSEIYVCFNGATQEQVQKKIDCYFQEYHPHGYGTRVTTPITQSPMGYWYAVVFRWHSCD